MTSEGSIFVTLANHVTVISSVACWVRAKCAEIWMEIMGLPDIYMQVVPKSNSRGSLILREARITGRVADPNPGFPGPV